MAAFASYVSLQGSLTIGSDNDIDQNENGKAKINKDEICPLQDCPSKARDCPESRMLQL